MFEIIKPGTNIDFVGYRFYAVTASIVLIIVGIVSLLVRGVNYGIDFAGGTLVQVKFQQPVTIDDIRAAVESISAKDVTVQDFGSGRSNEFIVRMLESDPELKRGLTQQVSKALAERFTGKSDFEVLRVESVGPRVGKDLRQRAVLAVLAATVVMGIYIALRFEARFGVGAAVALLHDVMVAVTALSLTRMEFDLTTVAALLTIVGYSVNDTVIVSDRIRENMRKNRREALASVMNRSINETLSRTILTGGTVLLVVLALFFLGGEIIHGFAFTLLIGVIVGTYSSVYIASPIVLYMELKPRARAKAAA
ncbi:MAG TPA: protein translocase subunit SecF [Candidatus Binatia bacterium]|nr:protein translocase subunit SecF [Candidatus Binatia bacterium]